MFKRLISFPFAIVLNTLFLVFLWVIMVFLQLFGTDEYLKFGKEINKAVNEKNKEFTGKKFIFQ